MKNRKQWISTLIKCGVSGGLIYWIFRSTHPAEIVTAMGSANIPLLVVAFLIHFIGHYISALRWRVLLCAQGVSASLKFLIQSYMVGMFFNNLLPSIIGGDTIRAYDSWKLGKSKAGAVTVVFVDRFLGLFALILFALGAVLIYPNISDKVPFLDLWIILGVCIMLMIIWIIFMPSKQLIKWITRIKFPFSSKLEKITEKVISSFLAFNGQKAALYEALWLSILLQINVVIHYYLVSQALHFPIPFYSFFLTIPLATFIMMIPIGINAIGIRESVFAFFFASYGVSQTQSVAFSWLVYGILVIHGLIGGIVYALRK